MVNYFYYSGTGNRFILIEQTNQFDELHSHAQRLCENMTPAADGILVLNQTQQQYQLDIINADGSIADMCGNGLRCAMAHIHKTTGDTQVVVHTRSGPIQCRQSQERAEIQLIVSHQYQPDEAVSRYLARSELSLCKTISEVRIGNRHLIALLEKEPNNDIWVRLGGSLQHQSFYPDGINVTALWPEAEEQYGIKTYERGVGPTGACGSATCSAAAVLKQHNKNKNAQYNFRAPGGLLAVRCDTPGQYWLSGDVKLIETGEFEI